MIQQKLYTTKELGDPGNRADMIKTKFPFPMFLMGDKNQLCVNFYGSRKIALSVIDAFQEILDTFGIEYIRANGLDNYGGCYEYRNSRGYNNLSDHAWGIALDYLPQFGPLGRQPAIPGEIVDIFKKRGFIWGGDWRRPDGMHWSARKQ